MTSAIEASSILLSTPKANLFRFWNKIHFSSRPARAPDISRHMPTLPQALSGRQRELARLLARGLSNRKIAGRLGIAEQTVKNHIRAAFIKLGIRNRVKSCSGGPDDRERVTSRQRC
jgi:DNA-binding NarL/FixJ family response regulator